jgi:hypothetical protein
MIMDTEMTIHTEQIDDLPLLFGLLQKMRIALSRRTGTGKG